VDIGRSFSAVMKDPDWIKKVLIAGVLQIIPIIGALLLYGFSVEIIKRVVAGDDSRLPEWDDWGGYLTRGFLALVGLLIWGLPAIILAGCAVGFTGMDNNAGTAIGLIGWCLLYPLAYLWIYTVGFMAVAHFSVKGQFSAFFEFSEIVAIAQRVGSGFLLLIVTAILAGIVSTLGLIALCIGVLFTSAFAQMVISNAVGQTYRAGTGGVVTTEPTAF
jgi:hypothetical protein